MSASDTPPKLNPYAPTSETPASPPMGPGPRVDQTVGGAEVIGNGVLGVAMAGAALGCLFAMAVIAWNWQNITAAMMVAPLLGIFFGFVAGATIGMLVVPIAYLLFTVFSVQSGNWTPKSLVRFAAICGLASTTLFGCMGAFFVNAAFFVAGPIAGIVSVPVTIRVFGPLRKMVAKRMANAKPSNAEPSIEASFSGQ